jgi:hypothetical protein
MVEPDAFIIRGHEKIIDQYRWLRDSSKSDMERERFQRRMDQERQTLNEYFEQPSRGAQRAA